MDPSKIIWLEYESFKIGNITVPKKVSNKMVGSDRVHIEATLDDRVAYILQDYSYICADPEALKATLRRLDRLAGKKMVDSWRELVDDGKFEELVRNLVVDYYDRCYRIPSFQRDGGRLRRRGETFSTSRRGEIQMCCPRHVFCQD